MQGCTDHRHQVTQEPKFCVTAPNTYEYSALNFLHASHQVRKISR